MISLKKSMDILDQMQSRVQASLDSYVRVLLALEHAAEVMTGDDFAQFRDDLKDVMLHLDAQAPPRVIQQSSEKSEQAIGKLAELIHRREWEYKQIIRIVAEVGATMVQNGSSYGEDLQQLASQIDSVTRLDSITEVRRQLATRVSELKGMAVRIQEEGKAKARALEEQLQSVQKQLSEAEALAQTDALTGLGNRRKAESTIRTAIRSGAPFCLIVFDLNGFKAINDTYGHAQGDLLLNSIAQQISKSVRDSDVVCRWGGDEFVVVMEKTPIAAAKERAVRAQANAFGQFVMGRAGQYVEVNITASIGTAEYRPGETPDEFFERADRMMYEGKSQREVLPS